MIRRHNCYTAVRTNRFNWIVAGTLAALAALATNASAALIFESLRFNVDVRSGGTSDTEEHYTDDDFPPTNGLPGGDYHSLPAINPNLAGSLQDASDLRLQLLELNGTPVADNLATIWISSNTGVLANNSVDTTKQYPILLEAVVYDDELGDLEKLVFPAFKYEPPTPFPDVESVVVSDNRGSMDDPITVTLRMEVGSGHVPTPLGNLLKVHLYWERMAVPEPSTGLLMLLGTVGSLAASRRRCR